MDIETRDKIISALRAGQPLSHIALAFANGDVNVVHKILESSGESVKKERESARQRMNQGNQPVSVGVVKKTRAPKGFSKDVVGKVYKGKESVAAVEALLAKAAAARERQRAVIEEEQVRGARMNLQSKGSVFHSPSFGPPRSLADIRKGIKRK